MKITSIGIKDYRGIKALDTAVPPAGIIASGANEVGKTTFLRAITAALAANGVKAADIRNGSDVAEIVVDMDDIRVRRKITRAGSDVTVTESDAKWNKPQTRLNELLGTCALDALDFFLADAKGRRRQIMDVTPVSVTPDDVKRWTGYDAVPVSLDGHGLEVLDRVRQHFYSQRTAANSDRDVAKKRADQDTASAASCSGDLAIPVDLEHANRRLSEIDKALTDLEAKAAAGQAAREATSTTRNRISVLRASGLTLEEADARIEDALKNLSDMRKAYRLEEARHDNLRGTRADLEQAAALEASLNAVDALAVDPAELATMTRDRAAAAADVTMAERRAKAVKAEAARIETTAILEKTALKAAELDKIVKRLTGEAPAELTARAGSIPGLVFDGDNITLDGVPIDTLSGAQQMRFAIDLARRANDKAKILIVDGLERVDETRREEFVRYATRDDWQLLASRVTDGALVLEAIES